MPYVVGTYTDPQGVVNVPLAGLREMPQERCQQSIKWQTGIGQTGVPCHEYPDVKSELTSWHICDPSPEPYEMLCVNCGAALHITKGPLTWEAYHEALRGVWGDLIPLTVAELRLAIGNEEGNKP